MCQPKVFSLVRAESSITEMNVAKFQCVETTSSYRANMCNLNVVRKKDVLSSGAGVKMSGKCESVTVNINILHLCRQAWIHRTGTPTCAHTTVNPHKTQSLYFYLSLYRFNYILIKKHAAKAETYTYEMNQLATHNT